MLLTALVAFLLIGNNTGKPKENKVEESDTLAVETHAEEAIDMEMAKVVFVDNDSLLKHFELYTDLQDDLLDEKIKLERQYQNEVSKLEKEYLELKEKAPFMTQSQGERAQAKLMQRQQELVQMEQSLTEKLAKKENYMYKKFKQALEAYLQEMQEEYGYDFVLGKSEIGGIHYANPDRAITWKVINGLNEKYRASKTVEKTEK